MICIVPSIKELYENNIKLLFELTQLNDFAFKFAADLEMCLLANGQQTATSSFRCPYYYISLKELRLDDEKSLAPSKDPNNEEFADTLDLSEADRMINNDSISDCGTSGDESDDASKPLKHGLKTYGELR
ncbi:hypothetical protein QAD02_000533 [Eretmocerus hayati]|uniref:Uncharacterized protein n=1 Tax=Eretmocerus hayati TaxID=131215 RepID=A0ACC2NG12_9HYME|nr:hypothetical protein QAD02_000533 [Eretmocerus hayati]